jgi:hypothetical protein
MEFAKWAACSLIDADNCEHHRSCRHTDAAKHFGGSAVRIRWPSRRLIVDILQVEVNGDGNVGIPLAPLR